jgi:hypothetical protein
MNKDITFHADVINEIIHAVKTAQQRRFAAPGRADEGRDRLWRNIEINIFQSMKSAIEKIQFLCLQGKGVHHPNFP